MIMKVKTTDAKNAYQLLKEMKMTELSDVTLVGAWKNLKALRPVAEEYDKDVSEARATLEDEEHAKMTERLQNALRREQEVKDGKRVMTPEDTHDVQEINKWFADYQARGKKFFDDIAQKEVEVEITKLPESEMLKALKENGKTLEVMESLAWMIE